MIHYDCPHCDQRPSISDEFAGTHGKVTGITYETF
jgi:hypothetical protein